LEGELAEVVEVEFEVAVFVGELALGTLVLAVSLLPPHPVMNSALPISAIFKGWVMFIALTLKTV
jgi:hypothetical protein